MKVIRKCSGWSKEFECTGKGNGGGGCGSILEVSKSDLYLTRQTDLGGCFEQWITFKCCVCGAETDIADYPNTKGAISERASKGLPSQKEWDAAQLQLKDYEEELVNK